MTSSKTLLAALALLAVGLPGLALAQTPSLPGGLPTQAVPAQADPAAPLVLVDQDGDDEEGGWFGFFGGHNGRHGGDHQRGGDHEGRDHDGRAEGGRDHDGRGEGGRGQGDDDGERGDDHAGGCGQIGADGRCMGQGGPSAPPANGLFKGGSTPRAQVN